jgi:leucyl-tRNA synthetase
MRDFLNMDSNTYFWNKIVKDSAFTEDGILVNSGDYDWIPSDEARIKLTKKAEQEGFGKKVTNYKLRDWIFSRQRYWGEPIPLIHISHEDKISLPTTPLDGCWINGEMLMREDTVV